MSDHSDQYRPGYHFTPGRHWMNDPNGLVHHNGVYHLYFQHNPEGDTWGNMSWGHATSPDLVRWTEHPVAIRHTDDEEIYSGSVVVDHRNTSGFGVGAMVAVYTSVHADGKQAQSLAYSHDGMTWTRYAGNPVLDRGSKAFRDPKVSWHPTAGWVMVAAEAEAREIVFYRSDDLRNWEYLSTFGPIDDVECLWECPDLFALPIDGDPDRLGWVLVVSLNPDHSGDGSATRYFVGEFDGATFTPSPAGFRRFDWGRDLYAAVSFDNEPAGRRILIGWMSNWDYAGTVPTAPWRGSMSLPREVSLVTVDGVVTLVQRPPWEVSTLDGQAHCLAAFDLAGTRVLQACHHFRVDVTFESIDAAEVGLDLQVGDGHGTRLRYDTGTERLTLDRTQSGDTAFHPRFASIESAPVPLRGGVLRLRVFVDRGSVEVFAQDGEVCLTDQVFAGGTDFAVHSNGGSARVSQLEWRALSAVIGS